MRPFVWSEKRNYLYEKNLIIIPQQQQQQQQCNFNKAPLLESSSKATYNKIFYAERYK